MATYLSIGQMIPSGETEKSYYIFNTMAGKEYRFRVKGDTIDAQLETIYQMSQTMVAAPENLMSKLPEYCDLGDVELDAAYDVLFAETNACILDNAVIYELEAAGEVLAGFLMDLGEALLFAL